MSIWVIVGVAAAIALVALFVRLRYVRPLRLILKGTDLLREQDFASRLRRVGQPDADKIVDLFNAMMESLKRERLRLREQNEFLDLLIGASPLGVIVFDDGGRISDANKAAEEMLGGQPLCGLRLTDVGSQLALEADGIERDASKIIRPEGGINVYRVSRGAFMERGWEHPFMLLELLTDEVVELERRAYMRAIRVMAHEVNNSVSAIVSTLHTVEVADGVAAEAVEACAERAESMSRFIGSFAELARVPEPQLQLGDFMVMVVGALPLLESICTRFGATLTTDLERAAPLEFDAVMLQQVIVNIVKNAAEAAGAGGRVIITADGRTLTVADSGPGLTPGAERAAFVDVYTSKLGGCGLGLMLVAEILRRHGARYSLRRSGELTVFTMSFD